MNMMIFIQWGLHRLNVSGMTINVSGMTINVSGLTINTDPPSLLHFTSVYINPTFAEAVNMQLLKFRSRRPIISKGQCILPITI